MKPRGNGLRGKRERMAIDKLPRLLCRLSQVHWDMISDSGSRSAGLCNLHAELNLDFQLSEALTRASMWKGN